MKQFYIDLKLKTDKNKELIKITSEIENFVSKKDVKEGLCIVFSLHVTGSIIINENEPWLIEDFLDNIERILPRDLAYKHNVHDNNAASHIAASLFSPSQILIIDKGKLQKGTWQDIFFLELDGPRKERKIKIKIIGE